MTFRHSDPQGKHDDKVHMEGWEALRFKMPD